MNRRGNVFQLRRLPHTIVENILSVPGLPDDGRENGHLLSSNPRPLITSTSVFDVTLWHPCHYLCRSLAIGSARVPEGEEKYLERQYNPKMTKHRRKGDAGTPSFLQCKNPTLFIEQSGSTKPPAETANS